MDQLDFGSTEGVMDGMDDIFFNDDVLQGVHLPTTTVSNNLPPELQYRLEDLYQSGCSQKIAWSRLGCIAYISSHGKAVQLQAFPFDKTIGSKTLTLGNSHASNDELVHVCWDMLGTCLAVVDTSGRISIHRSNLLSINNLNLVGRHTPNKADVCNRVIGMQWIVSKQTEMRVCPKAMREGEHWEYPIPFGGPRGPLHPIPERDALLFITRDGTLHMMTAQFRANPQTGELYLPTEAVLTSPTTTSQLMSHACTVAEDDNNMLVATIDLEYQISIYRLRIDWNVPTKEQITSGSVFAPSMSISFLASTACRPTSLSTDQSSTHVIGITQLQLLPPAEPPLVQNSSPPTIIITCQLSDQSSHMLTYRLEAEREQIQSAFQFLPVSGPKSTADMAVEELRISSEVDLKSACICLKVIKSFTTICIGLSNGDLITRFRDDLRKVGGSNHEASDVGGGHGSNVTNIAYSPNACAALKLDDDQDAKDQDHESLSLIYPESRNEDGSRLKVDLSTYFISATFSEQSHDDVLAAIELLRDQRSIDTKDVLHEVHVAVKASDMRFYTEHARFLQTAGAQRALSAQYQLTKGSISDLASNRVAWLMLDMLHFTRLLFKANESMKGDMIESELPLLLCGLLIRYVATTTYLMTDVLHLSRRKPEELLGACKSSPGIRFLLSYWGRAILALLTQQIHRIIQIRGEVMGRLASLPIGAQQGWSEVGRLLRNAPVPFTQLRLYLLAADESIKGCLDTFSSHEERLAIERNIIISGDVPEVFRPALDSMRNELLDKFLDGTQDPGRIMFAPDYWQDQANGQLGGDRQDIEHERIDVISKTHLTTTNGTYRKCTRCGSCTESMTPGKTRARQWFVFFARTCICGGAWVSVEVDRG